MNLSKSLFVRGVKCPKSLWLYKKSDIPRDEPDQGQEARFETGRIVGELARKLFPGGKEVVFDPGNFKGMISQTRKWLDAGVDTIYEATISAGGDFAMADILRRDGDGFEIYEVKSSTSVKDYHLLDVAFQYRAFSNFGLRIKRAFIIHIDNSYVRKGELDIRGLFAIRDVTAEVVSMQGEIEEYRRKFSKMLRGKMPEVDIGPHCFDFYDCDYLSWCWRNVPEHSIFDLYRLARTKKFELYRKGILKISDIPEGFRANAIQALQIETEKTGSVHVEREKIRQFLSRLSHPIHFFDFETFNEPVPRFDGQRPYMHIPFQYSLHILYEDGRVEHREFLADENEDPRGHVISHMLKDIRPRGSIVAFNKVFEEGIIRGLADYDPLHRSELLGLLERFEDLLEPFRNGGYYHPEFNGSLSLKSVLPAIFPNEKGLDYSGLEIRNGEMAMETFAALHQVKDRKERKRIRAALLEYCRLDTLALVRLYEFLREIAGL